MAIVLPSLRQAVVKHDVKTFGSTFKITVVVKGLLLLLSN